MQRVGTCKQNFQRTTTCWNQFQPKSSASGAYWFYLNTQLLRLYTTSKYLSACNNTGREHRGQVESSKINNSGICDRLFFNHLRRQTLGKLFTQPGNFQVSEQHRSDTVRLKDMEIATSKQPFGDVWIWVFLTVSCEHRSSKQHTRLAHDGLFQNKSQWATDVYNKKIIKTAFMGEK